MIDNWEIRREKEQKWNRTGEKQSRVNNYVEQEEIRDKEK